jgi:hypothetical protein
MGVDCKLVDKWHVPKKHRAPQRKEDNPIVGVPSNIWNSCLCIVYLFLGVSLKPTVHTLLSFRVRLRGDASMPLSHIPNCRLMKPLVQSKERLVLFIGCSVFFVMWDAWIRIPSVRTAKLCVTHARGDKLWRS